MIRVLCLRQFGYYLSSIDGISLSCEDDHFTSETVDQSDEQDEEELQQQPDEVSFHLLEGSSCQEGYESIISGRFWGCFFFAQQYSLNLLNARSKITHI